MTRASVAEFWGICGIEILACLAYVSGLLPAGWAHARAIMTATLVLAVFMWGYSTAILLREFREPNTATKPDDEWSSLLAERPVFDTRRLR